MFLYANTAEDKKDLSQEIIAQAWRSYGNFEGKAKFSTWLYKVAINTAITSIRKRKLEFESLSDSNTVPLQSERSGKELLEIILGLLTPVEKSIVLLTIEGYKQPEIAETLGISGENIRVKVHRIRKKLDKHGIKEFAG